MDEPIVDLQTALRFVTRRIEEEATRSSAPLTHNQLILLHNLPTEPALLPSFGVDPEYGADIVPRDTDYERLCSVAKAAHSNDVRLQPATALDWELAAAVSKLNQHPLAWLLQWAGVKPRKPWWDRWLLIAAALLFTLCALSGAILFVVTANSGWRTVAVATGAAAYIGVLVGLHFLSRRIERWQLKQVIEECRRGSVYIDHQLS